MGWYDNFSGEKSSNEFMSRFFAKGLLFLTHFHGAA